MIEVRLLGPVEVRIDGAPAPSELLWRKHLALMVYLARSPRLERPRDHLISLLWAEKPEDAARHSLNEAVRILRRYAPSDVDRQQQRVQLAAGAVTLDVDRFEQALAAGDNATASQLVAGEFMEGFSVPDAWEFEDWLARERNHWRERSLSALAAHARELLARGDARGALAVCERALHLDPTAEEVVRIRLNGQAIQGDRAGALNYYEQFVPRLLERLGVEPDARTKALVERIRAERVWQHSDPGTFTPSVRRAPLIALDGELTALVTQWQTCAREARCGLAIIEGDSGTGKTRLLEELAVRARLDGGLVVGVRAVEADLTRPWSTSLGVLSAVQEEPAPNESIIDRVRALLLDAAREQPVLVCVDDAHWLDGESAAALPVLLRDLARKPVLFALSSLPRTQHATLDTTRAHINRDFSGVVVRTRLLSADQLLALARVSLPDYDDAQIERVSRRVFADSAGLPFLAIELLYAIANGLELGSARAVWPEPFRTMEQTLPGELPDAIVAAIRVGYRKLSNHAQLVLAAASVLDARVTIDALRQATHLEVPALHEALDELEWQRWLVAENRGYSFVARIARDIVARDMLTDGQRQRFLNPVLLA